jgi:hypothetical protein
VSAETQVGAAAGATGPGHVARCTYPHQARELLDRLEAQLGPPARLTEGDGLQGDFVREVPGSSEPPD